MFNNCSQFKTMTDINPSENQGIQNSNSVNQPIPVPAPQSSPVPAPSSGSVNNTKAWPNEPTNFKVINDWGFDTLNGGGWTSEPGDARIVFDSTAPMSKGNVYEQRYATGFVGGISPSNLWTVFSPRSELYLGFWWKMNKDWQQSPANLSKIIFVSTNVSNSVFFYVRGLQGGPYSIGMQYQNSYIDNGELAGFPGIVGTIDLGGNHSTQVTAGEWYRLEVHIKKSTNPKSKDGFIRFWVNGQLNGDYQGMNFETYDFTSVPIVPIFGGTGGVKAHTDYFWYDHIHISSPN